MKVRELVQECAVGERRAQKIKIGELEGRVSLEVVSTSTFSNTCSRGRVSARKHDAPVIAVGLPRGEQALLIGRRRPGVAHLSTQAGAKAAGRANVDK